MPTRINSGHRPAPIQPPVNNQPTQSTRRTQPTAPTQRDEFTRAGRNKPAEVGTKLNHFIESGKILKKKAHGPEVKELQQLLNRTGANPPLQVDSKFGPQTEKALKAFQKSMNIKVDGKVGPQTLKAFKEKLGMATPNHNQAANSANSTSASALHRQQQAQHQAVHQAQQAQKLNNFATEPGRVNGKFGRTKAEREQQAERILKANGQWPPKEGHTYAIQIDQDAPPASAKYSARQKFLRSYSGEISVFKVKNGHLVEQSKHPYRSASHTGQFRTGYRNLDVNGDGVADIAHIRPGVFHYKTHPNYRNRYDPVNDREFNAARDLNHNGVIDGKEKRLSYSVSAIQIHAGKDTHPSSIGCQTLPPSDFAQFQKDIKNATDGQKQFTYILVRRPNDHYGENRY